MARAFGIALVFVVAVVVAASFGSARATSPGFECKGAEGTVVGSSRGDLLVGTAGRDVIVARGGDDLIRARAGSDLVCGGRGRDYISGGAGNDGEGGDDVAPRGLFGQRDGDTLLGRRGGDTLVGAAGPDWLGGGHDGVDRCLGGPPSQDSVVRGDQAHATCEVIRSAALFPGSSS